MNDYRRPTNDHPLVRLSRARQDDGDGGSDALAAKLGDSLGRDAPLATDARGNGHVRNGTARRIAVGAVAGLVVVMAIWVLASTDRSAEVAVGSTDAESPNPSESSWQLPVGWTELPHDDAPEIVLLATTGDAAVAPGGTDCDDPFTLAHRGAGPAGVVVAAYRLAANPDTVELGDRTPKPVAMPSNSPCTDVVGGGVEARNTFTLVEGELVMLSLLAGPDADPDTVEIASDILVEAPLALNEQLLTTAEPTPGWETVAEGPLRPRRGAATVWTGSEVLVWGGLTSYRTGPLDPAVNGGLGQAGGRTIPLATAWFSDGAAYDPDNDSWRSIAPREGSPGSDASSQASLAVEPVWTGTEWIFLEDIDRAVAYEPSSDTWRTIELSVDLGEQEPPASGWRPATVWTGNELIAWGGFDRGGNLEPFGLRFSPTDGVGQALPESPVASRQSHGAAWTGNEFITWGGSLFAPDAPDGNPDDVAAYEPASDSWRTIDGPVTVNGVESERSVLLTDDDQILVISNPPSPGMPAAVGPEAPLRLVDPGSGQWSNATPGSAGSAWASLGGSPTPAWAAAQLLDDAGASLPLEADPEACQDVAFYSGGAIAFWPQPSCDADQPGARSYRLTG